MDEPERVEGDGDNDVCRLRMRRSGLNEQMKDTRQDAGDSRREEGLTQYPIVLAVRPCRLNESRRRSSQRWLTRRVKACGSRCGSDGTHSVAARTKDT